MLGGEGGDRRDPGFPHGTADSAPPHTGALDPRQATAPARSLSRRWAVPVWLDSLAGWSWRLVIVGLAIFAVLYVLQTLSILMVAVLVAIMVATLLAPVKRWLERLRVPSLLATWIALLFGLVTLAGIGWWISTAVSEQLADQSVIDDVRAEARNWLETGPLNMAPEDVDSLYQRVNDSFRAGASSAGFEEARMVGEVLGATFIAIVLIFFFLKDGAMMWSTVVSRVAAPRRDAVDRAGRKAIGSIGGYVRAVSIAGVVDAVLIGALLWIVGVPLVIPLATLTFFGAFFPIVGATVAGAFAALVALVAVGPSEAIIVAVGVLVIQQVEGDVVLPIVMRRHVSLHPTVVLLALAVGGSLAGIVGAFVAVPFAAVLTAALPELSDSGLEVSEHGPSPGDRSPRPAG